jgi:hypothetical protein
VLLPDEAACKKKVCINIKILFAKIHQAIQISIWIVIAKKHKIYESVYLINELICKIKPRYKSGVLLKITFYFLVAGVVPLEVLAG